MVNQRPNVFRRLLAFTNPTPEAPAAPAPAKPELVDSTMPRPVSVPIQFVEKGSFGTEIHSGYIYEDYLSQLRNTQRADVFDKMRRSDSQIEMLLSAVKNPILGAKREIQAAEIDGQCTPETEEQAEFIKHVLFCDDEFSFDEFFEEALTLYDFGHSVFEKIHKVVFNHPKFGTYNGIKSLAFRSQRTLTRWNVDDAGKLLSVSQLANGDLRRNVDIDSKFLLVFTLKKEGANYEGISMLRACYGNWFRKNLYLKLNAVGIERFAVGTPIGKVPDGQQNTVQYDNFKAALEAFSSYHAGYLIVPTGWELTIDNNSYDPAKVETSIDREDERMARAFLANFLNLGMGGNAGAYALSNDLSDFMLAGLERVAKILENGINKVIVDLIKMKYGEQPSYPKLKLQGISDKAGKELAETLKSLCDGKMLTPDDKLEETLRDRYDLPPMDLATQRQMPAPGMDGPITDPNHPMYDKTLDPNHPEFDAKKSAQVQAQKAAQNMPPGKGAVPPQGAKPGLKVVPGGKQAPPTDDPGEPGEKPGTVDDETPGAPGEPKPAIPVGDKKPMVPGKETPPVDDPEDLQDGGADEEEENPDGTKKKPKKKLSLAERVRRATSQFR